MKIDYRELLARYIDHVGAVEGVDFLSERYRQSFTDDEWRALQDVRFGASRRGTNACGQKEGE